MHSVPCVTALNARKYSTLSDQPGRYNRAASYLKQHKGLVRNHAEDQHRRMNTLRRGPMSPQESLPAPLTGNSERLNPNRLRDADS